ncbi:PAS domain-containing sensor histidine kinase [Herbiconiux sp. CPCC 203407]|uniref:histidine kinase n=1 Tax=Herbiconiux oxytropis TaxID=2970915 RepID=A0AA42BVP8_9MICO|nr:PAS domain-containing sensor histidine kinase [Herbiconiux oxytropis]MCS5721604.1 PAS domain-containing sensor histidine kinase [Herbiconiux oxytropis]MCS5726769.1 PAS domain-containing sensor histidine kinase [Herbiconiux oxytropis]
MAQRVRTAQAVRTAQMVRVRGESRRQPFAQVMLFVAVVVVTVAAYLIDSSLIGPEYVAATLAVAVLTAVSVIVEANGWGAAGPVTSLWFAAFPLLDIVACIFIRAALVDVLPVAGLLVIFPIAWLSFAFPAPLMVAGIAGTAVVTAYPLLRDGAGIDEPGDWARVFALPIVVTLFAVATAAVGRDLVTRQSRADAEAERARAAQLSSTEATLTIRALVETSPDALAVFDLDGRAIVANDAALAVGLKVGRPDLMLVGDFTEVYDRHGQEIAVGGATMERILGGALAEPQRVTVGTPGSQLTLSVSARSVPGASGEPIAVVMVAHDVTELVHAIEVRDRFLDDVGHELKTPLTTILGHADLLADAPDAATVAQAATIRRAAERQWGVVNQLMSAGRTTVDTGAAGAPDASEVVEAGGIIERGSEAARLSADQKGVDLAVVLDAVEPVRFAARDLLALVEAITSNAVRFTPAGGTVVVGLRREGESALLEVSDTGIGMSPDEQQHAFDRFYRTASSREQAVPGLGLGLSIAQTLAESNGATISLESTPGQGTVVTVRMRFASGRVVT